MLLALSALDVAFVSAVAAAAAAVASPISAYAVARANHRHDRWLKMYEDRRDAYQRLLKVINARRITASAFAAALEKNDVEIYNAQAAAAETVDEALDRIVAVGVFAPDAVHDAVGKWDGAYRTLSQAVTDAEFATDDERAASAKAIRDAIDGTRAPTREIEEAIRADLRT